MTNYFNLLDTQTPTNTAGGTATMIIYLVAIVAFFYFFMLRPQKKQEKQTAEMRNSLSVGDEIVTIGGIIGRVTHIKEDVITIETGADRNKIRVRRSAIASVEKSVSDADKGPKGGYKVKSVKKIDEEKPVLKEDK